MKKLIPLLLLLVVLVLVPAVGCDLVGFSVTTTTEPPVISSFEADPPTIAAGASSTLEWKVSGATKVSIDPGIGNVALEGSRAVMPGDTTVYTLTAANSAGTSATATAQVIVTGAPSPPASLPVVNYFTANPPNIYTGGSATLSWNVSNATSVTIDPGLGTFATSGSTIVVPAATTAYILTAANAAGSTTSTAQVTVSSVPSPPAGVPVVNYFTANPPIITAGGSTTLSWDVSDATSVTIDQGVGAVASSGTTSVSPVATTNYTLTASNAAGWYNLAISVLVTGSPPVAEKPDLVITNITKLTGTSGYIIGYSIKNQGDAPCPATIAKLYVNGVYKASDSVPALAVGTSVDRQFTAWTYDPVTPVIKVVADANSAVAEADEGNNEKGVSIAIEIIVNFIDMAPTAAWGSGVGAFTFPGALTDSKGFACYRDNIKLEDGKIYIRVLETHPQWVNDGWIGGSYPELTIPFGAKIVAKVGFLDGAAGTDGTRFQIFLIEPGPPGEPPLSYDLLGTKDVTYDNTLDSFDISLAAFAGKKREVRFVVLAGASSDKDWAVWVDAKMIR